jgi:plasmid stabilization system protein ParE
MAYQIVPKERFKKKVIKVLEYLEREWSHKVAAEFLRKIDNKFDILSKQPMIGRPSQKYKNVRGIIITRHNKMYYRIQGNKIIIINLFDTRTDPGKIPY